MFFITNYRDHKFDIIFNSMRLSMVVISSNYWNVMPQRECFFCFYFSINNFLALAILWFFQLVLKQFVCFFFFSSIVTNVVVKLSHLSRDTFVYPNSGPTFRLIVITRYCFLFSLLIIQLIIIVVMNSSSQWGRIVGSWLGFATYHRSRKFIKRLLAYIVNFADRNFANNIGIYLCFFFIFFLFRGISTTNLNSRTRYYYLRIYK